MGHGKGQKFIALCGGIFIFILLGNLMGQIPGLASPTGNVNVPFGCAVTVWLYYHGARSHDAGPPLVPAPLCVPAGRPEMWRR